MRNGAASSLIAITLIALGLRLAWIANTDSEPPVLSDPQFYHATAANIADGRGYSVRVDDRGFSGGPGSEATAFWAPGYSAAIAVPYAVFGHDIRWAKLINALAGALACIPVFFIAHSLAPHAVRADAPSGDTAATQRARDAAGLLAAAIVALMPSLIFWTPALFSDGVFMLGVATTLALAAHASRDPTMPQLLAVGAALTATVFVRSQGVLLLVPVAALVVPRPRPGDAIRALAPAVVVLTAAVVPWAIRNERALGEPFLISSNVCYNLRGAHAPYATGTSVPVQDLWDEAPGISFKERELLFDELGCERAWEYARTHPLRELDLAAKRVGWLLRSDAAPAMRWSETLGATPIDHGPRDVLVLIGDVWWYAVLALAAASPLLLPRSRVAWALWALIAAWIAMHLVFHGEPRYHVAIVPALAALAAGSVGEVRVRLRRRAA